MLSPASFWRIVLAVVVPSLMLGTNFAPPSVLLPTSDFVRPAPVGGPPPHQHSIKHAAHSPYVSSTKPYDGPTPSISCDEGSMPEEVQGKAPLADYDSGRAGKGYFCNARMVSHSGVSGGYRVERYVDRPETNAPITTGHCSTHTTSLSKGSKAPACTSWT